MKKYEIEINNEVYQVTVKELPADTDLSTTQQPISESEATQSETTPPSNSQTSGRTVQAPMAGTILAIKVAPNQAVTKGDTLVILEAMKMENEIVAPTDGVVGDILVTVNQKVQSDDVLLTI